MDKKVERIIKLYSCLLEGKVIKKQEEAERFEVNQRTIQRDIDDIRTYFANDMTLDRQLIYDRSKNGYVLVGNREKIVTSQDILTVCKVFLESRSLAKSEMMNIIDNLVQCCVLADEQKKVMTLIANERFNYSEPKHGREMQPMIWDFADAVYYQKMVRLQYKEDIAEKVDKIICPMGMLFSQGSFYLTAYDISDNELSEEMKDNPVTYRMDYITSYQLLKDHFHVPYKKRYEEGEFRKRVDLHNANGWRNNQ